MPPSTSAAQEGLEAPEPQKQDIQFRDDGYILVNMSPDAVSTGDLGVVFAFLKNLTHQIPDVVWDWVYLLLVHPLKVVIRGFLFFLVPVFAPFLLPFFYGWILRRLGSILEQVDLALAQQAQDISEFTKKCSRYVRKTLGHQVVRQEPADLRDATGSSQTILSPPPSRPAPSSGSASSHPAKLWGRAKIIFPRGAAIDGSEDFTYRLVCAKLGKEWHCIHVACTVHTTDTEFVEMLGLIRLESSPMTIVRRILLGETVGIQVVEFEQYKDTKATLRQVDCLPPPNQGEWKYSLQLFEGAPSILASHLQHIYYHPKTATRSKVVLEGIPMRADLFLPRQRLPLLEGQIGYGLWIDDSRSRAKQAWFLTCLSVFFLGEISLLSGFYGIFQLHQQDFLSRTQDSFDRFQWMDIALEELILWIALGALNLLAYQCIVNVWSRKPLEGGDDHSRRQTLKPTDWVNTQGTIIKDHYFELVPGALDRLISQLPSTQKVSTSFRSVKAARQILGSFGRKLSRQFREVAQLSLDSSGVTASQPDIELDQTDRQLPSFGPHDSRSVLLCISNLQPSHHKTIVRFVNTINIEDDENLFSAFRNEYKKSVGRLRWWFAMRTIVGIRFVHFEVDRRALADIKHYSREDKLELHAIPPESHKDYLYVPKPVELIPPLGHNTLLEFWHRPENGAGRKACVLRIPTYRLDTIPLRHDDELGEAWGIEVIEGRKWEIFWYIAGLVFASSFVFAVAWGVVHRNLSDAFSVSSYLQTSFAIAVGLATLSASVDYLS